MMRSLSYLVSGSGLVAHVFCCFLPFLIKLLALLSGAGLTTGWGFFSQSLDWFHRYEILLFILSALVSFVALIIHFSQQKTKPCCASQSRFSQKWNRLFPFFVIVILGLNLVFLLVDHSHG